MTYYLTIACPLYPVHPDRHDRYEIEGTRAVVSTARRGLQRQVPTCRCGASLAIVCQGVRR